MNNYFINSILVDASANTATVSNIGDFPDYLIVDAVKLRPGISYFKNQLKRVKSYTAAPTALNLDIDVKAVTGPLVAGDRIGFRVYCVAANGVASTPQYFVSEVVA